MDNLTIEQELVARVFMHKVAVVGSVLIQEYKHNQQEIPAFLLEEQASTYSTGIIQQALENGTFEVLYNKAWEEIKDILPEHTKII